MQMLQDTKTAPGFPIEELARATVDFSGSDLRELCRNAAMVPVREYMRSSDTNRELLAKGQLEVRAFLL
jgi:ATPase family AAA domain-containing protein 1